MPVVPSRWHAPTALLHLLAVELGPPFVLLAFSQWTNTKTMLVSQIYNTARPNCRGGALMLQFGDEETHIDHAYPQMSIAKLMKCIVSAGQTPALDYAWSACPITMGADYANSAVDYATSDYYSDTDTIDEALEKNKGLKEAVDLSDTTKALAIIAVLLMMLPPIMAVGAYFVNCRELSFGSGRYIQWSWDLKRSISWKVCVGVMGVFQFGLFLFAAHQALLGPLAAELGVSWLVNSVGLQFLVIAISIKKVLTGVSPHHDLSDREAFDKLVFSRDLMALVSENNDTFMNRLVDALFRYRHGSDDSLNTMVGFDPATRESLLRWAADARELSTDGEDSCAEEHSETLVSRKH